MAINDRCNPSFPRLLCLCDNFAWQLMILYSILVDLSPTFYCLPRPLFLYGSMVLVQLTPSRVIDKMVVDGGRALQPCRYRWCTHMSCIIIYPYSTYPLEEITVSCLSPRLISPWVREARFTLISISTSP